MQRLGAIRAPARKPPRILKLQQMRQRRLWRWRHGGRQRCLDWNRSHRHARRHDRRRCGDRHTGLAIRDVEPYAIVGGDPAKTIRKRFGKDDIARLPELRW